LHGTVPSGPVLLPVSFGTASVAEADFGKTGNMKVELRNTFLQLKSTHNKNLSHPDRVLMPSGDL